VRVCFYHYYLGLGATLDKPISTGGEENILCRPSDRYYGGGRGEDIFLHEFAHAIHNLGVTGAIPGFDRRIRALYNKRKYGTDRRWSNTYYLSTGTRVKIEKINNLLQVDIDRREQGCQAAHYEQYCQHVVTALFNCNNLEQHG
jgi:hypothetical protein